MDICSIVLTVVSTVLGVVFALWYENLGSPRMIILPDTTIEGIKNNGLTTRFLHLKVRNNPRKLPFVPKQTAYACHGNISFLTDKCEPTNINIQFKWAGTPEPIRPEISNGKPVYLLDNNLIRSTRFIDIPPGEEERLAIAFRIKGDADAYGWSYLNYQSPDWRHPESTLSPGSYIARITITSGDTIVKKDIPFANPADFDKFDLVDIS